MKKKIPQICLIAAVAENRAIGKDNKLLWYIKKDLNFFKNTTLGHPIIMGRKTFESIGKPLTQRLNIIITRDKDYHASGCQICHSLEEALKLAKIKEDKEIFIIGGASVYAKALPFADKLYLTIVDYRPKADVFFPDYSDFKKIIHESDWEKEGKYRFKFLTLSR